MIPIVSPSAMYESSFRDEAEFEYGSADKESEIRSATRNNPVSRRFISSSLFTQIERMFSPQRNALPSPVPLVS